MNANRHAPIISGIIFCGIGLFLIVKFDFWLWKIFGALLIGYGILNFKIGIFASDKAMKNLTNDINQKISNETKKEVLEVLEVSIFSKLFSKSSDIEKQLAEQYEVQFHKSGMSQSQAKSTARDMLNEVKKESQEENMSSLPSNFGDFLLKNEPINEKINTMLAKRRKECVTDEDIRWWWNMHDLERRMLLKFDDIIKLGNFKVAIEEDALNENEAAKEVRKWFPIYGNPDDITHTTGEDRPLPEELKNRINIYIEKMSLADPEKYKQMIINSTSFNALIRSEIRAEKI